MSTPYVTVSFSGGKDSTAMLLHMMELGEHIDEVINVDTGMEFPAMYEHIAKVRRIVELRPLKYWHFAFDSMDYKDDVIKGITMLKDAGVDIRRHTNVYVYLHDDTQTEDALERCEILRELGTLPYIMVNCEAKRTQRMTDLKRWTRPHIFFTTDFSDYSRTIKKGMKARRGKRTH